MEGRIRKWRLKMDILNSTKKEIKDFVKVFGEFQNAGYHPEIVSKMADLKISMGK